MSETQFEQNMSSQRLHYMDNLRALAMTLGIFFHAAIAYNPMMENLWLAASREQSIALEIFAWFTHLFRMPLFFVIAGFFALLLIEKRGINGFAINRAKRIVMPFFIFMPLIILSVFATVGWAIENIQNLTPMMQFIKMLAANPDAPKMPFSTMHLWFLFNLSLFCLMAILLAKVNFQQSLFFRLFHNPIFVLLFFPLLLIPAMASQPMPFPAAERIYPELWSFGFYGMFFIFGMALNKAENLLDKLEEYVPLLLVIGVIGYGYLYAQMPKTITIEDMGKAVNGMAFSWQHFTHAVLEAYVSVYMTIVCLTVGRKFLNRQNELLRYISDSSYWVYIIHLPVLFYLQFILLDVNYGAWIEFAISSLGTMAIGMISYKLLVRRTPIGILLNGKRLSS